MKLTSITIILIAVLVLVGCISFGGKTKPKEIYNACKEALRDTEVHGQISIPMDGETVSGSITANLVNDGKGLPASSNEYEPEGSMIVRLWNIFGIFFILNMLVTWLLTKWLGSAFKNKAKKFLSLIPMLLITAIWFILYWFGWVHYHWIDFCCMNLCAWGVSLFLYDLAVKKGYIELLGKKI